MTGNIIFFSVMITARGDGIMKVVAINGSARKDGNTAYLINVVLDELQQSDIDTEIIQLGGERLSGCMACRGCSAKQNMECVINDDIINDCIKAMSSADGIILGTPVYCADVSSQLKTMIDRACVVGRANHNLFRRKVGAAVVAQRRAGALPAFHTINSFFTIQEMIVVGSNYWNHGFGRDVGEVAHDAEGIDTMTVLGRNMAWLLKKIAS